MKTLNEISKEFATEVGETDIEVLIHSEIQIGDIKSARALWNEILDRYIKQIIV